MVDEHVSEDEVSQQIVEFHLCIPHQKNHTGTVANQHEVNGRHESFDGPFDLISKNEREGV